MAGSSAPPRTGAALRWRLKLRVALLTLLEPARPDDPEPRAMLRVGGARVARHQLALALALGCERIVCVAHGFGAEMAELQHDAERAGAGFHVIPGPRALSPLVTTADELLVIADGLLPAIADAGALLSNGATVLVLPAETGIPAGFERVDLNHAAAGLMLVPGRLVERLMGLPADADPAAALLRIALQAGVAVRSLPQALQQDGRWLLVRNEDEAQAAEDSWMMRHTAGGSRTPGPLIARLLVRRFGPGLLHEGPGGALAGLGLALALGAIGVALTWFGFAVTGLALAAAGWIIQSAAILLDRLQRQAVALPPPAAWRQLAPAAAFDLVIGVMLVLAIPPLPGQTLLQRCFAPAVLLGLVRLAPRAVGGSLSTWVEDRFVIVALLALMAAGRVLDIGVPALSLLLLVIALVLGRERDGPVDQKLTRA